MVRAAPAKLSLVLDLDPDLGAGVPEDEWQLARQACRGTVVRVPRGRWAPPAGAGERKDLLGLVIVKGVLCREVAIRDRHGLEFLGPGDVLQLPVRRRRPGLGSPVTLTAVTELVLLGLGRAFLQAAAQWPGLLAEVHSRLEAQRERLAVQAVVVHLPRAEDRVLLMLWHLAEAWGRQTPEGVVLPIPLTHDVLGQLIAARRSTVTLAVGELEEQGCVRRMDDGSWLLSTTAALRVQLLTRTTQHQTAMGENVMLRQLTRETREEARALRGEAAQIRSRRPTPSPRRPSN